METVAQKPPEERVELHLLTDWASLTDRHRSREAGVISLLVHAAAIAVILMLPASVMAPPHTERHLLTPLIAPLTELTQKAPNKGPLTKEFNAIESHPRPAVRIPPAPPPVARALPPQPPPMRPAPRPAALPEPPKVQAALEAPPRIEAPPAAPPQIQAQEKPKLAFETPTAPPPVSAAPTGRVPMPGSSVQDAIRGVVRGGAGGGPAVGDTGGIGEAVVLPPSKGSQRSNLELLSDPLGVDFRPYLSTILARVRRAWFNIWPESARLGRAGRVVIMFSVNRAGAVPKLILVQQSGTDALDRAAVAAISAATPLPPLPTEFKGNEIRLQFNFAYNMPR